MPDCGAFTLLEMLLVVAVLALVAGTLVVLSAGAVERADRQLIQVECGEIRRAALRFFEDFGEPPRRIAELLQSPDPGDATGGWWWRADGTPDSALYSYDPATRRGWNGPYLNSDTVGEADQYTVEARLTDAGTYEETTAVPASGKRLSILLSRYSTYPQKCDGSSPVSHYQLDAGDGPELAVRFVADPLAAPDDAVVVARIGLGVEP